jgi:hypothetical protein
MMGTGNASGEKRAIEAAEDAISNPLLDDVSMKGARGILINITGGYDMTLYEVDEAANRIREEVDPEANIIFGSTFNENMNGHMRVSVVATGIDAASVQQKKKLFEELVIAKPQKKEDSPSEDVADTLNAHESNDIQSSESIEKTSNYSSLKKRSLFERLTGIKKSLSPNRPSGNYVVQPDTSRQQKSEDLDETEIPAFLRKSR